MPILACFSFIVIIKRWGDYYDIIKKENFRRRFSCYIKPIYNREDTLAFTFSPDQKKVEIGEEIKITVKYPTEKYDAFCDELVELIARYQEI